MGIFEFQLNAPGAIKSDCEHLRNSTFFQTVHQTCASKTHTGLSSPLETPQMTEFYTFLKEAQKGCLTQHM